MLKLLKRIWNYGIFKNQFIRFLIVGGINTVFGYSCYALLIYAGLHFALAVLISHTLGILFNFQTIGRLVFESRNNKLIMKFVFVYGITYGANTGLLKLIRFVLSYVYLLNSGGFKFAVSKMDMYIAGAALLLPMALLSFVLNRKFVFKNKEESNGETNEGTNEGTNDEKN